MTKIALRRHCAHSQLLVKVFLLKRCPGGIWKCEPQVNPGEVRDALGAVGVDDVAWGVRTEDMEESSLPFTIVAELTPGAGGEVAFLPGFLGPLK